LAPETTSDFDCKIYIEFETPLFQLLEVRIAGMIHGHIKMCHVYIFFCLQPICYYF